MISFVAASGAHVGRVATRMREVDRVECAAFGRSPKEALRLGLRASSFTLTGLYGGQPHAMFGVSPVNAIEGVGRPWFLGSDVVYSCARELLSDGPLVIAEMHRRFRRLENIVACRNERALRLLRRWGFRIEDETMTFGGVEFVAFWREADV